MAELSFGIKIWGDISNLVKSLNKGKDAVNDFGNKSFGSFAQLKKEVSATAAKYQELATKLGANSKEAKSVLNEFSKLKKVQNDINNNLNSVNKASDKSSMSFGAMAGKLGLAVGVAGAAKAAFDFLRESMAMTDAGSLKLEAATAGVMGAFTALKDRVGELINGTRPLAKAFDGLGDSIRRTGLSADALVRSMDVINDRSDAFVAQEARMRNEIAKLQFAAKDQTKSEKERKDALEKSLTLEREIVDFKRSQAQKAYDAEVRNIANRFFISEKVIKKIIEGDREATENLVANNKIAANAWDKLYGSGGEGKKLSSLYAEWIGLDTKFFEENKRTQSQLTGFAEQGAKAIEKLKTEQEELLEVTLKYMGALANGELVGPHGGMTFGDLDSKGGATPIEKAKSIGMAAAYLPQEPRLAGGAITTGPDATLTDWTDAINKITQLGTGLSSTFQGVFESIAGFAAQAATGFKDGWQSAMNGIGSVVQSGVALISELFSQQNSQRLTELDEQYNAQRENIENSKMSEKAKAKALEKLEADTQKKRKELMREQAKNQKTTALMQAIVGGALAVVNSFAQGGIMGIILGALMAGLVAAQIATIASQPLPALAEGGLASAPTLALVGDNPNARIDPEVISPLSKLREMIGMGDEQGGQLVAVVKGEDLKFVLDRANRNSLRRYGY